MLNFDFFIKEIVRALKINTDGIPRMCEFNDAFILP
jgi:hypothetical protein